MEHRKVGRVDGVTPVHIAGDQKLLSAPLQHLQLVRRGVAPQHRVVAAQGEIETNT